MASAVRLPTMFPSLRNVLTFTSTRSMTTLQLLSVTSHRYNTITTLAWPILPSVAASLIHLSTWQDRLRQKWQSIWDSVLRAVPKKKTSHMKKRHRQMAGKALKDVTALNKCSACGNTKRAHLLCPHCVASVQRWFREEAKAGPGAESSP